MGVELGGGDVGVPQQLLHGPEIRPALQEVRGKAVAQGVGVQPLDARHAAVLLADGVHGLARKTSAMDVEEDRRCGHAPHKRPSPLLQVGPQGCGGRPQDGHEPLLAALAKDAQQLLVEQDGAAVEAAKLARAQAAAVEDLQDGPVAQARGRLGEGLVQEGGRLLAREHVRQARGLGRQRHVRRGELVADALQHHEAVESLDGRGRALKRGGREPRLRERLQVALHVGPHDVGRLHDLLGRKPVQVAGQVAPVGGHGVGGAPPLDGEIVEVLAERVCKVHAAFPPLVQAADRRTKKAGPGRKPGPGPNVTSFRRSGKP